jgi:cell division protease FtsH
MRAPTSRPCADGTATAIDAAVRELIDNAFQKAASILTANHELLEESAKALLARETLSGADLETVAARLSRADNLQKSAKVIDLVAPATAT